MNNGGKSLMHVFWRSKLAEVIQPSLNLIAHGASDVVARDLVLIINQCLAPNLSVHFILSIQVVANIILLLCNFIQLLLSVDVHPSDGLPQVSATLILLELSIPHIFRYYYIGGNIKCVIWKLEQVHESVLLYVVMRIGLQKFYFFLL